MNDVSQPLMTSPMMSGVAQAEELGDAVVATRGVAAVDRHGDAADEAGVGREEEGGGGGDLLGLADALEGVLLDVQLGHLGEALQAEDELGHRRLDEARAD